MTILFCGFFVIVKVLSTQCGTEMCIGADFNWAMVASAPGRITPRRAPPYEELNLRHEFAHLF